MASVPTLSDAMDEFDEHFKRAMKSHPKFSFDRVMLAADNRYKNANPAGFSVIQRYRSGKMKGSKQEKAWSAKVAKRLDALRKLKPKKFSAPKSDPATGTDSSGDQNGTADGPDDNISLIPTGTNPASDSTDDAQPLDNENANGDQGNGEGDKEDEDDQEDPSEPDSESEPEPTRDDEEEDDEGENASPSPEKGKGKSRGGFGSGSSGRRKPRVKRPYDEDGNPVLPDEPLNEVPCFHCVKSLLHGSSWGDCVSNGNKSCDRCIKNKTPCFAIPEDMIDMVDKFYNVSYNKNSKAGDRSYASKTVRVRVNEILALRKKQKGELKTGGIATTSTPESKSSTPVPGRKRRFKEDGGSPTPAPKRRKQSESSTGGAVAATREGLVKFFATVANGNDGYISPFRILLKAFEDAVRNDAT
ncbi:hypothetical protein LX36DRAFT_715314 [Colletotrichum falcatum]|nr:hypothetical protein LX36DRAFT_715314 [Colletotrichum falcatum]